MRVNFQVQLKAQFKVTTFCTLQVIAGSNFVIFDKKTILSIIIITINIINGMS